MSEMINNILDGARRCFFQHGYTRSTMSMIAEYAGCSRVTLYKYFKAKEDVFRAICLNFIHERFAESDALLRQELSVWQRLEAIITSYIVSPFEEMGSDIISRDLVSASRTHIPELNDEKDEQLGILLNRILNDACQKNEIVIKSKGIEPDELAEMLKLMMTGMAEVKVTDLRRQAQRVVSVLRRILQPPE